MAVAFRRVEEQRVYRNRLICVATVWAECARTSLPLGAQAGFAQ